MTNSYIFSQKKLNTENLPAVLKENGRGFYIEYYAYNPETDRPERVRHNLNKLRKRMAKRDFLHRAGIMVSDINAKLASGWSPFMVSFDTHQYTPLRDALEEFLRIKGRELRPSTLVSYQSVVNILLNYMEQSHMGDCHSVALTHRIAIRFMDYLSADRDLLGGKKVALSNNAWNTYLKKYSAVCGWLVERGYLPENPFAKIKPKPKEQKKRSVISEDSRRRVMAYLQENNPGFIMVILLIYNSLVRPKEIETVRVRDINTKEHWVHIPAEYAKTHKERYAPLTDAECELLESWGIEHIPGDYYLVGHNFQPSPTPAYHGQYKKYWYKVKEALNLPKSEQLYSFKDSGISDMFDKGIDALTIMHAADHHDLSVTVRYAQQANKEMITKVVANAPVL